MEPDILQYPIPKADLGGVPNVPGCLETHRSNYQAYNGCLRRQRWSGSSSASLSQCLRFSPTQAAGKGSRSTPCPRQGLGTLSSIIITTSIWESPLANGKPAVPSLSLYLPCPWTCWRKPQRSPVQVRGVSTPDKSVYGQPHSNDKIGAGRQVSSGGAREAHHLGQDEL